MQQSSIWENGQLRRWTVESFRSAHYRYHCYRVALSMANTQPHMKTIADSWIPAQSESIVVGCKLRYKYFFCLFVSVVEKTQIRAPDSRAQKTWLRKKHKRKSLFFHSCHVKCFSYFYRRRDKYMRKYIFILMRETMYRHWETNYSFATERPAHTWFTYF